MRRGAHKPEYPRWESCLRGVGIADSPTEESHPLQRWEEVKPVGYQVASIGVFVTAAGDPIRRPEDRVTNLVVDRLNLERGVAVLAVGVADAGRSIFQWWAAGYEWLPPLTQDIAAFTLIVLGMQTGSGAFFVSTAADR